MSTINDIGIPGVGTGILHPKQRNRWRVTFANLGGGADAQPLSMQAITVARPQLTFDEVPLHRYNSVAWVAAKHSWSECAITVEDDVSGTAARVIQEQLQRQQWLIGAEGQWLAAAAEGSVYKFVTYIDMLDGNEQVIERWVLEGCWIKDANWNDLDYSTAEAVKINLSLRYDHARQDIGGYQGDTRYGTGGQGVATGGAGSTTV